MSDSITQASPVTTTASQQICTPSPSTKEAYEGVEAYLKIENNTVIDVQNQETANYAIILDGVTSIGNSALFFLQTNLVVCATISSFVPNSLIAFIKYVKTFKGR